MNAQPESNTRLRGRWLTIARVTWVTLVVVTVTLFAAGLVAGLGQLRAICTGDICRHPLQLSPEQAELNQQLGLSLDFYAWYTTIVWAAFGCVFFSVGVFIFWRRPNDPMALFVSLLLLTFGASIIPVIPAIQVIQPQLRWAQDFFLLIASASLPVFLILFPDGRFVPSWTRWLVIAWLAWEIVSFGVSLTLQPPSGAGIYAGPPSAPLQVALLVGAGAQVYRYRRVSTPLQRQQTKWVVLGFAGLIVLTIVVSLAHPVGIALTRPGLMNLVYEKYVVTFLGLLPILFIPGTMAISILRYRLWDIDIIIRRTLVYGAVTATLAAFYLGSVIGLQAAFRRLTGQGDQLAIVASTLGIAALFTPVRRRIQTGIDRRFYRSKYDAAKILAAFSATVRDEVDLDRLSERLVAVVEETMQPAHVSLWLRPTNAKTQRSWDAREETNVAP